MSAWSGQATAAATTVNSGDYMIRPKLSMCRLCFFLAVAVVVAAVAALAEVTKRSFIGGYYVIRSKPAMPFLCFRQVPLLHLAAAVVAAAAAVPVVDDH